MASIIRAEDVVGRLGGDEFVILIHRLGTDESSARDGALLVADKLIALVKEPLDFNGETLEVSASIGIRMLGSSTLDVPTALHEPDVALYHAKNTGRGRAAFFEGTEPTSWATGKVKPGGGRLASVPQLGEGPVQAGNQTVGVSPGKTHRGLDLDRVVERSVGTDKQAIVPEPVDDR